jgi:hypothetical protein
MKFLSRNAPALGARIIHNPREKMAIFLGLLPENSRVVYNFGAVLLD